VLALNKNLSAETQVHFQVIGPEKIPNNAEESPEKQAPISLSERY